MTEPRELTNSAEIDRLAAETGVAVAILDEPERERRVANNNSICRSLNPSGVFSPECRRYCGRSVEKVAATGKAVRFECHAGLECRAVPIGSPAKPSAAIVGRTFVKPENYRKATERAVTGDWSHFAPADFFENILLTGSDDILNKVVRRLAKLGRQQPPQSAVEQAPATETISAAAPPSKSTERVTALVERFNREMGVKTSPEPPEPEPAVKSEPEPQTTPGAAPTRPAGAQAWRSFFSSLLSTDYTKATESILEFIAEHYGFSKSIWLERNENRLENTAALGELKDRKVRLSIAADDHRLVEALSGEMPLELAERTERPESTPRKLSVFPIGVGGEISSAIAILDEIETDDLKKQIARVCHSIAPQLEILRLRSQVASGRTLSHAVRGFNESLKRIDADDVWVNLTQTAAEMLRAERASLLVFDDKSDTLDVKALIGARGKPAPGEEIGSRVSKSVFSRRKAVIVPDVTKTGLPPAPENRQYKTSSFLSYPISISGRTLGVMNFADRASGAPFDRASLELFHSIAPQLAMAIDRASLKEKTGELEQLSVTDALTGMLNRRYMEARLSEEMKRSNRHGFPTSFMMLDVDHFKSYNDQYGHPAGDEALKAIGQIVRATLRSADVAARFGGEEFCILLPQTKDDEAAAIGERIRANVEQAKFARRRVTVSIGIATCNAELCLSADLVSAADKALYEAKRRGRNRVVSFDEMGVAYVA